MFFKPVSMKLDLSASGLDLGLRGSGDLVDLDRELTGELAVAEHLDGLELGLGDASGLEGGTVDNGTVLELDLERRDVHSGELDTTGVLEAGELGETHRERGLAALETGALGAARSGSPGRSGRDPA